MGFLRDLHFSVFDRFAVFIGQLHKSETFTVGLDTGRDPVVHVIHFLFERP